MTNEPMRRSRGVFEPNGYDDVRDFASDYGLDALKAGVDPDQVASALREAADEVEFQARENPSLDLGGDA